MVHCHCLAVQICLRKKKKENLWDQGTCICYKHGTDIKPESPSLPTLLIANPSLTYSFNKKFWCKGDLALKASTNKKSFV